MSFFSRQKRREMDTVTSTTQDSPVSGPSGQTEENQHSFVMEQSQSSETPIPFGNPPGYTAARIPVTPVKYQFSQLTNNSMVLVPPADYPDTRPLYHISVNTNCFMPFSFTTVIRKGGTEHGPYVGEFEMGVSTEDARLYMEDTGVEQRLVSALKKDKLPKKERKEKTSTRWKWQSKTTLVWDSHSTEIICYPPNSPETPYAKFYPVLKFRQRNAPPNLPELEVYPSGHKYLDDIIVSALVMERQRLTPKEHDYHFSPSKLFNFPVSIANKDFERPEYKEYHQSQMI